MSFDTDTRNRLARFVATCRKHLCGDYQSPGGEMVRQLAHLGIQANGDTLDLDSLTHLSEHEREQAQTLRDILDHKRANSPATKTWKKFDPTVYDLIQEQGFTALNRLCALRMAEERKILAYPCLSKGHQSDAFQLYEMRSGKNVDSVGPEERYELFLFSLFDELSLDLGALFDRRNAEGLLFPAPAALAQLLEEINDPALAPLWAEDETIGWIYQYWNSKEERKAMRDASAAPRNSRELAVRNQFFTPRYVVEFLTDNTLGRIWYEMTKGQTRLSEQCRYLVRRPTEIFLGDGEDAPDPPDGDTEETLSQEELLKQPVHIPHRPVKDPREIRLLDPACGSMHFGLYAFDLFEAIYEEAWDKGLCPALQKAYPEKADYLRDVPRLIIEHNIHGVDIDPRAVQIAGLSLWLRAQKTWKDTPSADRPRVRRSNIVCAEPMPGSDAMLEDFVQTLDPPLLGELVKTVFDKMQLAGEAGTLLKIEEEIRTAIDDAKAKWEKLGAAERDLFSAEELNQTLSPGAQQELTGIEKALTTDHRPLATDFFDTAEERIYTALREFAESAEAGDYQRRLFAEDAAHGFAFIDLCRQRYDAVVMNPPFGETTPATNSYIKNEFPVGSQDLACAFTLRWRESQSPGGFLGAIITRNPICLPTTEGWRTHFAGSSYYLRLLADLGYGVLDAKVETAALVASKPVGESAVPTSLFFPLVNSDEKDTVLDEAVKKLSSKACILASLQDFNAVPASPWSYWSPRFVRKLYGMLPPFQKGHREVKQGIATGDDFRFLRLWWETSPAESARSRIETQIKRWVPLAKGGRYAPYLSDITLSVNWSNDGAEIRNFRLPNGKLGSRPQNTQHFFRPGLTFIRRTSLRLCCYLLPRGCAFSDAGPTAFTSESQIEETGRALAFCNSLIAEALMSPHHARGLEGDDQTKRYDTGLIQRLPWPEQLLLDSGYSDKLDQRVGGILASLARFDRTDELNRTFLSTVSGDHPASDPFQKHLPVDEILDLQFELMDRADISATEIGLGLPKEWLATLTNRDDALRVISHELSVSRPAREPQHRISDVISQALGGSFGRWDIRYATGERQPPELPDPFDPLPVCPPGMLQNADGLPAAQSDVPDDYPLPITWPGILVSDPGHPEDIVARVRDALAVIWGDRSAAIEQEACEILGVRTLRDYFAEKKSGGKFFKDHLKRYSKSRRQAPIYWPLSTESGTYTLWIYYHRLTEDTLYACITNFVAPKQEQAEKTLARLAAKGDARTKAEDKEYEQTEALIGELATFRAELERLAKIWKPDLNDGVQITAAPLWSLFRLKPWQKKLKDTWQKLEAGDYDWAHQAHTLWPDRVIPKCATDRSLAIAHGYEQDLWEEVENDKSKLVWQPKENAKEIAPPPYNHPR